jgi:hypothetical protein
MRTGTSESRDGAPWTLAAPAYHADIDHGTWSRRRDNPHAYPPYLHPPVAASMFWAIALRVQEFDKGRGPVGFAPIGQACDLPV